VDNVAPVLSVPRDPKLSIPNLLLLEDDPIISHVIRALLGYGGMSCDAVASAEDAFTALDERPYAAILIDLSLPKAEGLELIRWIRSEEDIPIIVISGQDSDQDAVSVLEAGADDLIRKPFLPNELLVRVRSLIRRSVPLSAAMP